MFGTLFFVIGIFVIVITAAINHHVQESKKNFDVQVVVTGTPVVDDYTECAFMYKGERYVTRMSPCIAEVGEEMMITIDAKGYPIIYSGEYVK